MPSSSALGATTYSPPSTPTVTGSKVGPLWTVRFRHRPWNAISSSASSNAMIATNTHEGPGSWSVTANGITSGVAMLVALAVWTPEW